MTLATAPLSTPQEITSLKMISDRYDTFLVDMVGVVYDGIHAFPESVEAINHLIESGKTVLFVSNNPRPSTLTHKKLLELGIHEGFKIVTSGDYMRHLFVTELKNKAIYHIGAHGNADIHRGIDVNFVDSLDKADAVLLSAFIEEHDDPDQYDSILSLVAKSDKPVYCPNPDVYALYGKKLRKTAGFFVKKLVAMGGSIKTIGKPDLGMYEFVLHLFPEIHVDKSKTLMIGDTIGTDIEGAQRFGIESLLVKSGVSGLDLPGIDCTTIKNPEPTYVMEKLTL